MRPGDKFTEEGGARSQVYHFSCHLNTVLDYVFFGEDFLEYGSSLSMSSPMTTHHITSRISSVCTGVCWAAG